MYLVRPIKSSDLDDLVRLANSTPHGLTTLPKNKNYLKAKIDDSLRAFDDKVRKPGGEAYIFVLEDVNTGYIFGTSGIISKIGGFEPFYTYKIESSHYQDQILKVDRHIPLMHLKTYHNGPSEICSLFIDPAIQTTGYGRLLSLTRFQFMAEFPHRFDSKVISEMRGHSDENGNSPFWECVGRHFFDTDFSYADSLSGLGEKEFINNLMPKYPIYIPMLPKSVQEIIGKVHKRSQPAFHLLESEGFRFENEVDIFDAGPTIGCPTNQIRSIRESATAKVKLIKNEISDHHPYIVSNGKLDFRSILTRVEKIDERTIGLNQKALTHLELSEGDKARYVLAKGIKEKS